MVGKDIDVSARVGGRFSCYLASPEAPNGAVIVLLQEIFGVTDNIRRTADMFARRGYTVIAPDLFWRQQPGVQLNPTGEEDRERAMALMQGLDEVLAVEDCLAAADHARTMIGKPAKTGVVGYCLGGKIAYRLAGHTGIDAAVSYYGVAIHTILDLAPTLRVPILLNIGAADQLCPPAAQRAILNALPDAPSGGAAHIHPGVGHAFARLDGADFNAKAAARANNVAFAFLEYELDVDPARELGS